MSAFVEETLQQTYTRLVPASRKPTREQQLRYLQCRSEGLSHTRAARSVGSTGRRFRSLLRNDPQFRALYEELSSEFDDAVSERIRHEMLERAFDRTDDASPRLLLAIAEARLPEMDYRRTRRIDQRLHHEHEVVLDTSGMTLDELRAVRDVLAAAKEREHEVIEAPAKVRQLPPPKTGAA